MSLEDRKVQFKELLEVVITEIPDYWKDLKELYDANGIEKTMENELFEEFFQTMFVVSGASDVAIQTLLDVIQERLENGN